MRSCLALCETPSTSLLADTGSHAQGQAPSPAPEQNQRGWWQGPHRQSWELPSMHTQDYLLLTKHQDQLHCCFWYSCSLLPKLFAPFGRFDCPPAWEQEPALLILGRRGTGTAVCQARPPSAHGPAHSSLLSPERHSRCCSSKCQAH